MKNRDLESSFEEYRRDRKTRRLQHSGPARPMGKNRAVLQQIEAAEQSEVRDERLTREVHDFFADATRTAAGIVQKISGSQEEESGAKLRNEIEEFLGDVIRRAETFMTVLGTNPGGGVEQHLETQMQNLVGQALDSFRYEGTARLQDKHIGQDPFKTPISEKPAEEGEVVECLEEVELCDDEASVESVPIEEDEERARTREELAGELDGIEECGDGTEENHERVREAIEVLVSAGVLKPTEARNAYEEMLRKQA